ncbi:glycosyl hydrolase [Aestuariivivens sediminis]|uniref:glycosyl hydrolase n=1 Tax=Aestuariivivens sediminis TaxID=2913557 RepID=UPI001F5892B4|nr:glycosyl hydrolase [Aestuariivivens sediminis]
MKKEFIILIILMTLFQSYSQQLTWTGFAANNDFFDETNWKDSMTDLPPEIGTIDADQPINIDLEISDSSLEVILASGIINLGSGTLSITSSALEADALSSGHVIINSNAYLNLNHASPFQNGIAIDFTSDMGWIRTLNKNPQSILNDHIGQITVNGAAANYQTNLRLDNYYAIGTVIRGNNLSSDALTIFDDAYLTGQSANLSIGDVHNGVSLPNHMENKMESFLLKKGFMATFAVTEDGTGKSKNYIASEEDLIINELPNYLVNNVSFIRVVPWNWVAKKGIGGIYDEMDHTWYYNWGNGNTSRLATEYAPMAWGYGGANDDGDIANYKSKYKVTHVLAFNESDNCEDQSGQWNNLCNTDVAVNTYKNLMKTGLRLVSPNCRENAPFGWLKEFHDKANAQDIRIDVIGVHWYDWGSSPKNSPNADPQQVFNRFKNYLQRVYDLYKLPIWITEFNANPNRSTATNYGFMQLALPYLETLDYVERYCWYQPNSDVADYYTVANQTTLTDVGYFYNNQNSTPAIPEATVSADSNLDIYYASTLSNTKMTVSDTLIFPNPCDGIFTIKSSFPMDSLTVFDVNGKIVKKVFNLKSNQSEINLKDQKQGLYLVIIKDTNGNTFTEKLISIPLNNH